MKILSQIMLFAMFIGTVFMLCTCIYYFFQQVLKSIKAYSPDSIISKVERSEEFISAANQNNNETNS